MSLEGVQGVSQLMRHRGIHKLKEFIFNLLLIVVYWIWNINYLNDYHVVVIRVKRGHFELEILVLAIACCENLKNKLLNILHLTNFIEAMHDFFVNFFLFLIFIYLFVNFEYFFLNQKVVFLWLLLILFFLEALFKFVSNFFEARDPSYWKWKIFEFCRVEMLRYYKLKLCQKHLVNVNYLFAT